MFTGLVESTGKITALEPQGPGIRLVVDAGSLAEDVQIGDSIANNGCCLTVIEIDMHLQTGDDANALACTAAAERTQLAMAPIRGRFRRGASKSNY